MFKGTLNVTFVSTRLLLLTEKYGLWLRPFTTQVEVLNEDGFKPVDASSMEEFLSNYKKRTGREFEEEIIAVVPVGTNMKISDIRWHWDGGYSARGELKLNGKEYSGIHLVQVDCLEWNKDPINKPLFVDYFKVQQP